MVNGHKPHSLEGITGVDSNGNGIHYTCNAPSQEVLKRHGIISLGENYGCSNSREVLQIPADLCKRYGIDPKTNQSVAIINYERMMRELK